jgi:murein DD-endopeptidase MepM/ murein hydrolase activator NlpD
MRRGSLVLAFLLGAGAAVALLTFLGWEPFDVVRQKLRPETPHESYTRSLLASGLSDTALAREWLDSSNRSLENPVPLTAPFAEQALIDAARPLSLGYAVELRRGQAFTVQVQLDTDVPGRVFVDLFEPANEGATERRAIASARTGETSLSHEARNSGRYVLRVQPELLRGGRVRVVSSPAPSLAFPVEGAQPQSIRSVFGDPRDAGVRRHEGVDIFAPRGTPVVAATDGLVVRVGETARGGRTVWLLDPRRGISIYYAHLDTQHVSTGAIVRAGETLGTVGNTGNARTTPPHLHFGIYARGEGAIDPDAFIRPVAAAAPPPALKASTLGGWATARRRAPLRASPSPSGAIVGTLAPESAIRIEGALGGWVRTRVGDRESAFVEARALEVRQSSADGG